MKKILIVDDDVVIVRLVEAFLSSKGFKVLSEADGLSAMATIKKEKPDLVILDVILPELNGYDICYILRFGDNFEHVPIILISEREKEVDEEIFEKTDIEYLQKPINTEILLKKIKYLLNFMYFLWFKSNMDYILFYLCLIIFIDD